MSNAEIKSMLDCARDAIVAIRALQNHLGATYEDRAQCNEALGLIAEIQGRYQDVEGETK